MKINKLYRFFVLTSLALFCFCNTAIAQQTVTELKATVVDEQGSPINGVNIYAPNGVESSTELPMRHRTPHFGHVFSSFIKRGFDLRNLTDRT